MYDMNISVPAIKIQKDKNHLLKKEFDFTKKKILLQNSCRPN